MGFFVAKAIWNSNGSVVGTDGRFEKLLSEIIKDYFLDRQMLLGI